MMRLSRIFSIVAAVSGALWLASNDARAQELSPPKAHQGYYLSLSLAGTVMGHKDKDVGWLGPQGGPLGALRMGQAVTPYLDLGIAVLAGAGYDSNRGAVLGRFGLEAQVRPIPVMEPAFLRVGVGFGLTDVFDRKDKMASVPGRTGAAYVVAIGYDFFPGRSPERSGGFSLSPVLGLEAGPSAGFSSLAGWIGLELGWWTGLPKAELELPEEKAY
ncbi:MAG: hypothetical protein MUC50_06685 [Myxococcota bacterium]|jgi:hypothetical protein|nr:hypothetical protein [Myxococcota bacterium]